MIDGLIKSLKRFFTRPSYWVTGLALCALGLFYGLYPKPKTTAYLTASVERRTVLDRVVAKGEINAYKSVDVGAQVSGQLNKMYVKLGDQVHAGELLAEIDAVVQANTLKNAQYAVLNLQAQLRAKEALHRKASIDFKRHHNLYSKQVISEEEYEASKAQKEQLSGEVEALKAQIVQAQIAVEIAETDLGYTKIVAPMNGVVTSIVTEEGQTVISTQQATTILVLKDLSKVTVKVEISEADLYRVKPGMQVFFTTLGQPEVRHFSQLRAIEPDAKTNTRISSSYTNKTDTSKNAVYYNGLFDVENFDAVFYPSMTTEVSIVFEEAVDVLTIPITALSSDADNRPTVKLLKNGRVITQNVETGINDGIYVEVKAGVKEKDLVLLGDGLVKNSGSGTIRHKFR